ncbi:MAG: tRNA (adenosine(37)-N6)-threonylcarbamoyltransferase complex dimerization subunit type 1 TsaB [Actinobacteria bacterium]|nr:tRNA (adenosine(37)-N6)-threonylcarbamoyltransferase complex dimerization subunit type 1 TsaB [Actinomycetota bacterium]
MLILAFDTSSPVLTAAIGDEERLIEETMIWLPRGHMAKLIPVIDGLLQRSGLKIGDVEAVVIGSGPGSYTGLRIGMVVARTFAQLLKTPIIGIPSADAIAYQNVRDRGLICPVIDAKRGEVYTALYHSEAGKIDRFTEFRAITPDELTEIFLVEGYEHIVFAGDAVKLYAGIFAGSLGDRAEFAPENSWWARASDLINLARPRLSAGDFDELYRLTPIYVRLSQAEEMWEKRHQG